VDWGISIPIWSARVVKSLTHSLLYEACLSLAMLSDMARNSSKEYVTVSFSKFNFMWIPISFIGFLYIVELSLEIFYKPRKYQVPTFV